MCTKSGEMVDHLLLHCEFARAMGNYFSGRVGLAWVMPKRLVDFLANWRGLVVHNTTVWKVNP